MRTELGLVLKHVSRGTGKVVLVNYLSKKPPLADEYYYEEDIYGFNDQTRGFWLNAQGLNQGKIGAKVKETKVGAMTITIKRVNVSEIRTTTTKTTSIGTTMLTEMKRVIHMVHLKIGKLHLRMVEVIWSGLRMCCRRWGEGLMQHMRIPRGWEVKYHPCTKGGCTRNLDKTPWVTEWISCLLL